MILGCSLNTQTAYGNAISALTRNHWRNSRSHSAEFSLGGAKIIRPDASLHHAVLATCDSRLEH